MDHWLWRYEGYEAADEGQREALCTLGNGYIATRGALPECAADGTHYPGTYVAGLYNRLTTRIADRDVVNESLVNLPNWLPLRVRAEGGEWFSPKNCGILSHVVELDMRRGLLTRRSRLEDGDGRVLSLTQRRLVSLRQPHLLMLETTLVAENWSGPLEIASGLDGTVRNSGVARYDDLDDDHLTHVESGARVDDTVFLVVETNDSHVRMAESARLDVRTENGPPEVERWVESGERMVTQWVRLEAHEGTQVILDKTVTVATSRDLGIYEPLVGSGELLAFAGSFDSELESHLTSWRHAWNRSHISIEGDVGHTARVLNLHVFHLLQTVSKESTDLDVGVPARGLHGEAYRGHVFWDELFIFPFLNLRVPEITRTLLRYRARRLDQARRSARAAGYTGAMYPWQSGSDGREETQELHLNPRSGRWLPDASHLQRHINAAISYNVWSYWQVTADQEFMRFWGAEMMCEIARFWSSIATYHHALDRYEITTVMGPDEYHDGYPGADSPGLDNNAYTNVMAVWCILRALDALEALPDSRGTELRDKLALRTEELDRWQDVARKMRLCFHGDRILSQFEGYDDLEELDWDAYRMKYGDIQRLDRILEAEGDSTNRYKLCKQADTLMLFYLFSTEELSALLDHMGYEMDPEFVDRNIAYYESRTAHGSTLSAVVHAWINSRRNRQRSWELFRSAMAADINDIQHGTTAEGIHLGAMAGSVDLVQRCYAGIETREDALFLNPRLPDQLHHLSFTIRYRSQQVSLEISREEVCASVADDGGGVRNPITLQVGGTRHVVQPGRSARVEI